MAFVNFRDKKKVSAAGAVAGPNSTFRANCTGSGTQLPPGGGWQTILFNQEVFDQNNEYANNKYCPVTSGQYYLHTRLTVTDIPINESAQARIIKNSSEIVSLSEFTINTSSGTLNVDLEIAGLSTAVSGDCFHIEARQTDIIPHQLTGSGFECFFEGFRVQVGERGKQGITGETGTVASGRFVIEELTPQVDGITNKFNLTNPATSGLITLFYNGQRQTPSEGYFLDDAINSSGVVTCFIPKSMQELSVEYFV